MSCRNHTGPDTPVCLVESRTSTSRLYYDPSISPHPSICWRNLSLALSSSSPMELSVCYLLSGSRVILDLTSVKSFLFLCLSCVYSATRVIMTELGHQSPASISWATPIIDREWRPHSTAIVGTKEPEPENIAGR